MNKLEVFFFSRDWLGQILTSLHKNPYNSYELLIPEKDYFWFVCLFKEKVEQCYAILLRSKLHLVQWFLLFKKKTRTGLQRSATCYLYVKYSRFASVLLEKNATKLITEARMHPLTFAPWQSKVHFWRAASLWKLLLLKKATEPEEKMSVFPLNTNRLKGKQRMSVHAFFSEFWGTSALIHLFFQSPTHTHHPLEATP